MRINVLVNAPWGSTAYSGMARTFGPRLLRLGHTLSMTALWGLEGGMIDWCGIPIYAKGVEAYTRDIQAAHAKHFRADVFMSWCDAFAVEPKRLQHIDMPWSPWFPVDAAPVSPKLLALVEQAEWPLVYSRFGLAELHKAGVERARYMPVGIDTDTFRPKDKTEARSLLGLPIDRYIVGMVQANSVRKTIPQQMLGFAAFKRKHPDALLYIHTFIGNQSGGVDLRAVCERCGLRPGKDVMFAGQHAYLANMYGDEAMSNLYNSFDVLLSVTGGEGFGVPIVEAAACGVPAIVGDWSSMSELNFADLAHPVEDAIPWWNDFETWYQMPRPAMIAALLEDAYQDKIDKQLLRTLALDYDADAIARDYWLPLLSEMESGVDAVVSQNGRVYA